MSLTKVFGATFGAAFAVIVMLSGIWELKYGSLSDASEVLKPQISGYQVVTSKLGSTFTKNASAKTDQAQEAYNRGDIANGDRLAKEAFDELNHGACITQRNCSNGSGSSMQAAFVPAAPQQVSVVVAHDVRYEAANDRQVNVPASDPANGEYYFAVDPRFPKEIPLAAAEGDVWVFSFSDTLICAYNVPCVDAAGQGGKPGGLPAFDHTKINADDFPFQDAHYQEAVASTGDGVFGIGNTFAWTVTNRSAGKPVSVAFNIRRSEIGAARGGGILKIKIIK